MTKQQYDELCKIFEKELTVEDLKDMRFSPVDGEFDEDLDYDIGLYRAEKWRREGRKNETH